MSERDRFRRVEELFHAALEIPPAKRRDFLAAACDDPALVDEVEALLAADSAGTAGAGLAGIGGLRPQGLGLRAGDEVGPYRIVELIGEGGMGEVYRAEQTGSLQREVALKVVKAGLDTRLVLKRFENERQTLALMNHPGVARVFDAGATGGGRPYFVMELVAGRPITTACDQRGMSLDDRLELFARVCEAVRHAHRKGVIHRDLKPSNILVEEGDGPPRPKIIDFGIAKATTGVAAGPGAVTLLGQVVGTPEYMSPEQAERGENVDTRTDVYSLGVLLYELLTGAHPFDVERLRESSPEEVRSYLREAEPVLPSRRVARGGEVIDEAAAVRGSDRAALARALRGDLDWIVAKAMEREPDRRYESAAELAADVRRYQRDEPVEAGPPSRLYRARKFVRRHRLPVAVAAVLAVVLVGSSIGVSIALVRARRAEADALRQAAVAEQVTAFLGSLFEAEDPYAPAPESRSLEGIVGEAAERLESGAVEDPEVFGRLALSLGSVMLNQGMTEEGARLLEAGVNRLRADERGATTAIYLDLLDRLSYAYEKMGRWEEARAVATELVALAPSVVPPDSPKWGLYLMRRGDAERTMGKANAAEPWLRQALAALRSASDVRPTDLAPVLGSLANITDDAEECSELAGEQLRIWTESVGAEHPRVADARAMLSTCARLRGDAAEAARHGREVARLRTLALGAAHPQTLWNSVLLADSLYQLGRFDEARQVVDASLAAAREAGDEHSVAVLLNQTHTFLPGDADFDDARRRERESVDLYLELFGGESAWSLMSRHTLADLEADSGNLGKARTAYLEVVRRRRELVLPRSELFEAMLLDNLANVERRLGLYDEAEEHLAEALAVFPSAPWDPRYHARAWVQKAALLTVQGRADEAGQAFARAQEIYGRCQGPTSFLDLRYEAAFRALQGDRERTVELVRRMLTMGVHPDFLGNEPELMALLGPAELERLAREERFAAPPG